MGAEDNISEELVAALGSPRKGWQPTEQYKTGSGLSSLLSGEGSCNIPKLRYATRLLHEETNSGDATADTITFWHTVLDTERRQYMISEFGSHIYREWHFIPTLAIMRSRDQWIADEALEWCAYYLALSHLLDIDGRIYWPGQRSAGHATIPGIHEWVYAKATGESGAISRAESWCKQAGAGLKNMWEFAAVNQLDSELSKARDRAKEYTLKDLQARGYRRPLYVYKSAEGLAAWIGPRIDDPEGWSCDNGNTPPVPGVIVRDRNGEDQWFPADGGVREQRVRQRFDHCRVVRDGNGDGNILLYTSDIYGGDIGELPGGKVELDTVLGTS